MINAAGAWADEIARKSGILPVGLTAYRRTVIIFDTPTGISPVKWPGVSDVDEEFYFTPEGDQLLGSPADETASNPCDARADDWDIAVAVDRIGKAVNFEIRSVYRKWAGLRTFATDRTPVIGFDSQAEGFFWLAGQGGYGIQTASAVSRTAASLILGQGVPADLMKLGVNKDRLSPNRKLL